jgi:hypothetical protein
MISELSYVALHAGGDYRGLNIGPPPDSDPYGRNPNYWNSRKSVQIPIKQYMEWVNVNIWTCEVAISHSYVVSYDDEITTTNTLGDYAKVFEVNVGRENKTAGYTVSGDLINPPYISGQVYETTDPSFPMYPQTQGAQPESWWMKQRSNVLIGNHQRSYFNATANWENYKNPIAEGTINFNQYFSFFYGILFNGGDIYYDPDTKMICPYIAFEYDSTNPWNSYGVNWYGSSTSGDSYHVNTAALTVDGVTIPAEVGYNNTDTPPSVTVTWTPGSTRDL